MNAGAGRVVVNPEHLRDAAGLMGTAETELGSLAQRLVTDGLPEMPADVAARVRAGVGGVSSMLSARSRELGPEAADLKRRALWAELLDRFNVVLRGMKRVGSLERTWTFTPPANPHVEVGDQRKLGFEAGTEIYVKTDPATGEQIRGTEEQRKNIERVLRVGIDMNVPRKLLVCAVMTITQESVAGLEKEKLKLGKGDRDSVGLFQQRPSQGWAANTRPGPATREELDQLEKDPDYPARAEQMLLDPEFAARKFFEKAIEVNSGEPNLELGRLCSQVQRDYTVNTPREGADYKQWQSQAENTVAKFPGVPSD